MAEGSIYKFIVHKKWTTLSPQKVDDYKPKKWTTLSSQKVGDSWTTSSPQHGQSYKAGGLIKNDEFIRSMTWTIL